MVNVVASNRVLCLPPFGIRYAFWLENLRYQISIKAFLIRSFVNMLGFYIVSVAHRGRF